MSVCSEERVALFSLFLTEYTGFIYLHFFYETEKRTLSLPVSHTAL